MSQVYLSGKADCARCSVRTVTVSPLTRQLQQQLQHSPHGELRSVRVQEQDGIVRLEGFVSSFYVKQLAQTLVGRECLAGRIENAIEVA